MLVENIRLAIKDFGSNVLRTVLSVLGIVIGVGSVIAITTLGRSATTGIQAEVADAGLETISVMVGRDGSREERRLFVPELAADIADIAGVATAAPLNQGTFTIRYGRESYDTLVMAVDDRFAEIFSYGAQEGRFFTAADNAGREMYIVLGAETASILFPDGDAVGSYVRLFRNQAKSFRVVGVMESRTDTLGVSFDTGVYVPYNTYTQRLDRIDSAGRYIIRTAEGTDVLEVAGEVERFFLDLTGNEDSYRIVSPSTMAEMFTGITEILNLFLTGIAAISLVVGGIGIMNIMLVSVTERTREIGVRKALGARPAVIRGQFLTEAVALTLLGGLIGIAAGTGVSLLVTRVLHWPFSMSVGAYVIALAFSSGVGLFFGLYPAIRASNLDPVVALSYE